MKSLSNLMPSVNGCNRLPLGLEVDKLTLHSMLLSKAEAIEDRENFGKVDLDEKSCRLKFLEMVKGNPNSAVG